MEETSKRLLKRTFGLGDDSVMELKKNAFRYPNDPSSEIPQAKQPIFIDKRTRAIPTKYLVKEKGIKHKNLIKLEQAEKLESELKKVHDKVEGNLREGEVIDLNKMVETDEFGNIKMDDDIEMHKFNSNDKQNKNKSKQMDIDHMEIGGEKNARKIMKNKKKKKTKSHFIVNY